MAAPKTRSAVVALAKRLGCELEVSASAHWFTVEALAPIGQRFEPELHALVAQSCSGFAPHAWAELGARLAPYADSGLERCDDASCEWCDR